jgi:hypothetical protein
MLAFRRRLILDGVPADPDYASPGDLLAHQEVAEVAKVTPPGEAAPSFVASRRESPHAFLPCLAA